MSSDQEALFKALDSYDWDKDAEFKAGLQAILGPNPETSQIPNLEIRAKCFYYSRKMGQKINYDAYKAHLSAQNPGVVSPPPAEVVGEQATAPPAEQGDANPAYPTSFADIVALINSGAPIPGIKEIPPTVLSDKATQPTASRRRKPWEKEEEPVIQEGEGTFGNERDQVIPQNEFQA